MFNNAMLLAAQAAAQQLECARQILRLDSITPYFQPKVSMTDDQVVGFEALLRWQDEQGQLQLPATVCAAFSDYELASRIGEVMRTKVLRAEEGFAQVAAEAKRAEAKAARKAATADSAAKDA